MIRYHPYPYDIALVADSYTHRIRNIAPNCYLDASDGRSASVNTAAYYPFRNRLSTTPRGMCM